MSSMDGAARRARYRGVIVGGAVGDALGAPVEFASRSSILTRYGPEGVTGFLPWINGCGVRLPRGSYTDDTQLTLATAVGLLRGLQGYRSSGVTDFAGAARERYVEWLALQDVPSQERFPGSTCLSALRSGQTGSVDVPINDRKGSGGIMRVAPVGLAFEPGAAFENAMEIAALTHGHPSGYLAAGVFADLVAGVVRGVNLKAAVSDSRELLLCYDEYDETLEMLDLAVELFVADADLDEAYELLGEGWMAEEALGIAVYSALSFPEDFAEGVLSAVNITGDSDTTGSLTGALLGASLGYDSIPGDWAREVEDARLLLEIADDLFDGFVEDEALPAEKYPPYL